MATKQEKAIKTAVTREKNKGKVREEKHVLWLLVAVILLLLYLLLAQHNGWWPYMRPKLGTAFYTNVSANTTSPSKTTDSSATSSAGSGGTSGGGSSTGSGGGGGGTSTTPTDNSLANFAATVNVGDTKTQVNGQAKNLGSGCAVVIDATAQTAGKQEVCTYSQGDKIVTVTYLNDRVISASKSGF